MTTVFSIPSINRRGSCPDILFPEIIAQIFGQPSPCCSHFEGQWIGTGGHELPVDKFGNAVASARYLPGGDFQKAHTAIQVCLLGMAKQAGLTAFMEGTGFFAGRVAPLYLQRYMRATASNPNCEALIPDLIVHKYKSGASLMGEVKRNGIHAGYGNYKTNTKAVEVRARSVKREYIGKAKKLDRLYAAEVNSPGPFENSLSTFFEGGVTPFCFGAFGEASGSVDKFVQRCAKLTAVRKEGLTLSPFDDTSGPLGAYGLVIRRFRTALAMTVAKENALLKSKRTQFIRSTRAAAAYAAKEQKRGGSGYFDMNGCGGFGTNTYEYYFSRTGLH